MGDQAEELIEFLDQHWCAKMFAQSRSRQAEAPTDEAIRKLKELRIAYLDELRRLSPDALLAAARDAAHEQDRTRPFNRFGTDADYDYFGRCAFLTVAEAVALSLGKDPRIVDWAMVKPFVNSTSPFAYAFATRLDLIERAVAWGELPKFFTPLQFLTWAHKYKLDVPGAFVQSTFVRGEPIRYWHDQCEALGEQLKKVRAEFQVAREKVEELEDARATDAQQTFEDWLASSDEITELKAQHEKQLAAFQATLALATAQNEALQEEIARKSASADEEKPDGTVTRKSLLIIAISTANDGYGYDPRRARTDFARMIADAALRLGLKMSDDTVRSAIKEALRLKGLTWPDASQ